MLASQQRCESHLRSFLLTHLGRQADCTGRLYRQSILGPLLSMWKTRMEFQFPAAASPNPGCCDHLRRALVDRRNCLSVFQINQSIWRKKKKRRRRGWSLAQWLNRLIFQLSLRASHMSSTGLCPAAALLMQLPAYSLQGREGSSPWAPAPTQENQRKLPTPDFRSRQPFGEWTSQRRSLSLLSINLPFK